MEIHSLFDSKPVGFQMKTGHFCSPEITGKSIPALLSVLLIFVSIFSFAAASLAATNVSGNITANTTWTLAGSPYIVTADVYVRHGSSYNNPAYTTTLTIEPGVEVRFNTGTGLHIGWGGYYGALSAQGTAEAPIIFTSNAASPAPGNWKGIYFTDQTHDGKTVLEYCTVEYGGQTNNANVYVYAASFPIRHSAIRYSSMHGIRLTGASPAITNSSITNTGQAGIYLEGASNPTIGGSGAGNVVADIGTYPIYCVDANSHPAVIENSLSDYGSHAMRMPARMNVRGNTYAGAGSRSIVVLGDNVTADTIWRNEIPRYIVTGDVYVQHGSSYNNPAYTTTLTIEPGIEVRFNNATGLHIGWGGYYGALSAQGTAEAPIVFTSNAASPAPGNWKGIYFTDQTNDSKTFLDYCTVEYGGHTYNADIYLYSASFPIKNSTIRRSSSTGILLESSNPSIGGDNVGNVITSNGTYGIYCSSINSSPAVVGNTISNNGSYPLRIRAQMNVRNNTFSGNGQQAIAVLGENVMTNTIWRNQGVSYIVTGDVYVQHGSSYNNPANTTTLTIEPGVEVRFNTGTGLHIGWGGYYGALSAQGTAEAPIIFTSNAASPAPGNWKGIYFTDQTNDSKTFLDYCTVEYGGHTYNADIYLYSASFPIKNSTIRRSSMHGIRLTGASPAITNSSITNTGQAGIYLEGASNPTIGGSGAGNVVADIGTYPIYCVDANSHPAVIENSLSDYGSHAMRMPARMNVRGNTYAGAGSRSIVVLGDNVTADTIWRNEIPRYIVTGDVYVQHGSSYNNPAYTTTLTIEPGVEVRFNTGTGLHIGWGGYYGALSAQGTAEAPIIFTSNAASPAPGNWKGIYFTDQTHDGLSRLEHCVMEYGGHTNNTDIYLYHAKPTIQYNTIRNSSHSGIYVNGAGSNGASLRCNNLKDNRYGIYAAGSAQPSILNNNFLTSQTHGLYNASGVQVKAENNWWGDPNGPGYNGDSVYGSVDFTPWLTAASDCITSPPTNLAPYAPKTPSPANGAVRIPVISDGQPIAVSLGWVGSDPNPWDTLVYDVYFGTAADSLVKVAENLATAQFAKADLAQGVTYYWRVIARDNAGAETAGPVWHFTTLGSPPDLVVSEITWSPAANLAAGQTVTLTATIANSGEGPVVAGFQVDIKVDGVIIGTQSVSPVIDIGASFQLSRTWTATVGTHTVEVTADSTHAVVETFDNNNSLSVVLPTVSDPAPPLLVSSSPANGSSLSQAGTIMVTLADEHGTVDDAAVIASFIVTNSSGQPVSGSVTESSDQFIFTPAASPLPNDTYQVALTARDLAGNTQAYSFSFTVDNVAPEKPVITGGSIYSGVIQVRPYADNRSKTTAVTLSGARESNTAVWVNAVKKVNIGSGDWATGLTLAQGSNALEIWLTDAAGNRGPSEWVDIFVDSVAPAVTGLIAPANNSFVNVPPAAVKVGFQEAGSGLDLNGSTLSIKDSSFVEVAGSWIVSANQLVFTPAAPLQDSNYSLNIQLKDNLTNQGAVAAYHFTVDTLAPVKPVVNPVASPALNPSQTISGAKAAYDAILLNGQEIIGNTSAVTWQHAATLTSGANTFTFTARDRAGNVSEATIVEIVYDDVAPDPVTTLAVNGAGSGTSAVLNWTYNESIHGDIAAYRIFYETAAFGSVSGLTVRAAVNAGAFSKTFQDLTRGSAYYFAVVPVDGMGHFTDAVTPVAATLTDILPPAEATSLKAQSFADRLVFTWTHSMSSDLASYKIYFNSAATGILLPADRNTHEQTGLSAAAAYPFKVTAIDNDNNESSGAAVTGHTWLPNPGNLSADPKSGYVDLSWSHIQASQYLKHYRVYASESNFTSVEGMTPKLTVTATTAKAAGLTNQVPYFFAVTSVNLSGGEDKTVTTITATPVPDQIGPGMSNFKVDGVLLSDGYTLTAPGSFSLDALDPAGVSRVEFYLDGALVRTDYSPAYTWFWNIVESTDGSHSLTIKAYDTLGNSAEATYTITVALAVPAAPVISQPANGTVTNKAVIAVSGSGPKYSDIIFYINDAETGPVVAVDGAGNFSASLTLTEGENRIQAAARNRAGAGPLSAAVIVTLDTSLPQAPTGLTALSLSGGQVRLTWQKPADNVTGYTLYRAATAFSEPAQATRVNAGLITGATFTDLPPADGIYYYRVATVDSAGNESELSASASAVSDRTPPRAVSIAYTPHGKYDPVSGRMAAGSVDILLTVSEALQAAPFLTLTPENGVPAAVTLSKVSETTYSGVFVITSAMPSGTAYAVFSARDAVGNRGTEIDAGASIKIDAAGPAVTRLVIWPNDPIKTDAQNPVAVIVTIGLNEKVKTGTAPALSYLLSKPGRDLIEINDLNDIGAQSGDVQTWQGTFTLPDDAGLSGAETLEFLYQGADDLDNLSDRILADHQFQVYQGDLPPLAAPDGLKAEVLPGGRIRLSWNAVAGAVGYQLYRQGPGESELSVLARVDGAVEFIDSPPADGIYLYAAASIRAENGQEAVSGMCPPITVNSDSAAPGAPRNLTLQLVSQGIKVAWEPPVYTEPVTYSIYRSPDAVITSVDDLTPLAVGITQTVVIDPNPSQSDHSYVATAVDAAGNESAPSNSVYLNFSLLPVSGITVVQQDSDVPAVSWTHTGAGIAGYDIYLGPDAQRSKLNSALLTAKSFTDVGYSQDERRYTLVAVDANGIESLSRSLTLPVITAGLADGAGLKRGSMNRLEYSVKNLSTAAVSNVRLKVRVNGKDHVSESFSLQPGAASLIPVIVGGYSDMEDIEPLATTIEITPNPGEVVRIVRSSEIEVGDGMLVLQIANDELIRGGAGSVRFTLENSGDAEVEIITAQNSGGAPSAEVIFSLVDGDNNVLSTQKFKQTIGSMVVGLSNGNTVARIPAGAIFASSPVNISVPAGAPDDVAIRLSIANLYYHHGKSDQVKMNGLSGSYGVTLADTAYYGKVVSITPQSSTGDSDIVISGQAVDRADASSMPNVALKLVITLNGFERSYNVFTDAEGNFSHIFAPLAGEGGVYNVRAVHPDLTDKPVHGVFTISRISITPAAVNLSIPKNYEQSIHIQVGAGDGTAVTNLRLEPLGAAPAGVHLTLGTPIAALYPKQTGNLSFTLWADNSAAQTGQLRLDVRSDESLWGRVQANLQFSQALPVLTFTPDHIETGVSRESSVTESVTLKNTGLAPLENVQLALVQAGGSPAPSWLQLVSAASQGSIAVGASRRVDIAFAPGQSVAEGAYTYYLKVASSNYQTRDIGLYVSVTQSGIGNVLFKVTDIYTGTLDNNNHLIQGLSGARIWIQNEAVLTEEYSKNTDSVGEALFSNIPAGRYKCRVTAGNHQEYIGRFWIKPGLTESQEVFLGYNLVTVEWSVNEITIQDKYEVILTATYETNVPAAVVVAEPSSITIPAMKAGDVYNGEFSVTNYGLVRADNLKFTLPPSDSSFRFEVPGGLPQSLAAKARISVPFRLTSLQTIGQGDGTGGGCERWVRCMVIDYEYECAAGNVFTGKTMGCFIYDNGECTAASGPVTGSGGGGVWNISGTTTGGGSVSAPAAAPEQISGVKCFPFCGRKEGGCDSCRAANRENLQNDKVVTHSHVQTALREYQRDTIDLTVKAPGGAIEVKRWYYGNKWRFEHERNTLKFIMDALGSRIETIDKGDVLYTAQSTGADIYIHDIYRIVKTADGWRWEDPAGGFKTYDAAGRVLSEGTRTGTVAKYLYEPGENGKLIGVSDRSDNPVITFEYNGAGLISAAIDSESRRVEYSYQNALLTTVKDVPGFNTVYQYDGSGRITKTTDAASRVSSVSYDNYGNVASVLDGKGKGHFFEFDYDSARREFFARITTSAGMVKEVWYDKDGETKRVDVNGRTLQVVVKDGRNLIVTDENGRVTRKEFDEWDNLTRVTYPDGSTASYEYEHTFNRRIRETDENGIVTVFEYDASGNLTRRIEAVGSGIERITEYSYDADGNLLSTTRIADGGAVAATTTMTYDAAGNLTSVSDPEGGVTVFTHDIMGNVLTRRDVRNKLWTYEYDTAGRLGKVTDPLNSSTQLFYDAMGNKTKEIDAEGKEKLFEYDISDNMVKTTDAASNITLFEYNTDKKLIKQTDAEGKVVNYQYDSEGRLVKTIDGNGNEIALEYDDAGGTGCTSCSGTGGADQPSKVIYPTFTKVFNYDVRGRKVGETDVLSDTESYDAGFVYDAAGNLISKTDKENRTTNYVYDDLNRLSEVIDPAAGETQYAYDNRDNLIALTDAKGQDTRFEYDRNNRLTKEIRPGGQETAYGYDAAGNLIEKLDARNQKTKYGYNDAGRLVEIRYFNSGDHVNPAKTVVFAYDKAGNLKSYDDGITSAVYDYDEAYRKISEEVNFGAFTKTNAYTYYKNGLKQTFTGPDGIVYGYLYDSNNQLTGVQIPNLGFITIGEYTWNRPASMTLPGGSTKSFVYDPLMRVKEITAKDPGQNILLNYQYTYDKMDNITDKGTEHGAYIYGYDDLYRLTAADNPAVPNLNDEAFTYDPVGNRLTSADTTGSWFYNNNNELLTTDNEQYQYDANGNMTQKTVGGVITKFFYNLEDRLERVEDGAGNVIATYYYDPFGRRLWKEVSGVRAYFHYADEGLVAELDASGNVTKSYRYKPGSTWTTDPLFMKVGTEYFFYHNDHLGTPQKLTAVNGAIVWSAKHSSFGKSDVDVVSTIINNLRFPGQYFDQETALNYNYYRYYDPKTGRYLRTDPIYSQRIINSIIRSKKVSDNIYLYVSSNPVNTVDPQGLTDFYKNMPQPKPSDAINIINHFLDFFNASNLSSEAMHKIFEIEWTIDCAKKESASVCFEVYPRPHKMTVNKGGAIVTADGNRKCVTVLIVGRKNCCKNFN